MKTKMPDQESREQSETGHAQDGDDLQQADLAETPVSDIDLDDIANVKRLAKTQPKVFAALQAFSGPMPRPEDLSQYQQIQSDLPERMMAMAEREQAHRHDLTLQALDLQRAENTQLNEEIVLDDRFRRRGQYIAGVLTFAVLTAGTILALTGHPGAGTTIMSINIVALATAFLTDRFKQSTESVNSDDLQTNEKTSGDMPPNSE